MGRKIRILYIIDKLACAGTQRQLIELLRHIDRTKFEPAVCCLLYEGDWGYKVRELGIPIHVLGLKKVYGIKALCRLIQLVQMIRKRRFDIVHNYLFAANVYGTLAAKIARVKAVINSRRQAGYWNENPNRLIWRFVNKYSNLIIANSENVRSFIAINEGVNEDDIVVIHNGIETAALNGKTGMLLKELSLPKDSIVICIVANLTAVKGHIDLIKAFEKVILSCSNAHLICVGDGPLKRKLAEEARIRGLCSSVHFLGRREDVNQILADADIGVMASLSEGLPNAILEYMRWGIPVASTAVGGVTDIIRNDENGLLVSPGDIQALSETLIRLCESPQLRRDLGASGYRDAVSRFSSLKMAESYEKEYQELLSNKLRTCNRSSKIAYIISQFPAYDETFVAREIRALVNLGVDITIISLKSCRDKIVHNDDKELQKRTVYLPFISVSNLLNYLYFFVKHPFRTISAFIQVALPVMVSPLAFMKLMFVLPKCFSIAKTIEEDGYAHIHAHWATLPTECAMLISRLTSVPFSFTGHAHDIFLGNPTLGRKVREAEFILTCTHDNKEHLLCLFPNIEPSKIVVSHHGVDLQKYIPKYSGISRNGEQTFKILAVGSLLKCKGFEYLIEACSRLKEKGVKFECNIIGGGHLFDHLSRLINNLGLHDKVHLLGYMKQDHIVSYYRDADLFILPAISEIHWGIPNVLLESLAVGTPVACTPLPAIRELINSESNCGYTIAEKDPEAISDLIEKCASDGDELLEMGKEGIKKIQESFDLRKNSIQVRDVFYEKAFAKSN